MLPLMEEEQEEAVETDESKQQERTPEQQEALKHEEQTRQEEQYDDKQEEAEVEMRFRGKCVVVAHLLQQIKKKLTTTNHATPPPPPPKQTFFSWHEWNHMTYTYRWHMIVFWLVCMWPLGMYYTPKFISSTSSSFRPVVGTPSHAAEQLYNQAYGVGEGEHLPVVALITVNEDGGFDGGEEDTLIDGTSKLYTSTRDFVLNMTHNLQTLADSFNLESNHNHNHLDKPPLHIPPVPTKPPLNYATLQSYYSLQAQNLPTLAKAQYASPDGRTTILQIHYATTTKQQQKRFLNALSAYAHPSYMPPRICLQFTGIHYFQQDMLQGVKHDMQFMDTLILPTALLVLLLVLGCSSPHGVVVLIVLPIVNLASVVWTSMGLMYFVTRMVPDWLEVTQFTPSFMMSLCIGLGVDYTLFLVSRFLEQEEVEEKEGGLRKDGHADLEDLMEDVKPPQQEQQQQPHQPQPQPQQQMEEPSHSSIISSKQAVLDMLEHSGHTILTSGLTLGCCFLGLLFLPLPMLASVGLGASIAVVISLLVNLSLTPALLHTQLGTYITRKKNNNNNNNNNNNKQPQQNGPFPPKECKRTTMKALLSGKRSVMSLWPFVQQEKRQHPRHRESGGDSCHKKEEEEEEDAAKSLQDMRNHGHDMCKNHEEVCSQDDLWRPLLLAPPSGTGVVVAHESKLCFVDDFDEKEGIPQGLLSNGHSHENNHKDTGSQEECESEAFHHAAPPPSPQTTTTTTTTISKEVTQMKQSSWYKLATYLLHPQWSKRIFLLIMLLVGLVAPFSIQALQLGTSSISFDFMVPKQSPSQRTFHELGFRFGWGTLSPYRILFHSPLGQEEDVDKNESRRRVSSRRIDNRLSFHRIQSILAQLSGRETFPATPNLTAYSSITTLGGHNLTYWEYEAAVLCGVHCPLEVGRTIASLAGQVFNSADGRTTLATVLLDVDPYSAEGLDWLFQARSKVEGLSLLHRVRQDGMDQRNSSSVDGEEEMEVYIQGAAAIEYDAVHAVYAQFGAMVVVTLCIVFALMGVVFKSLMVPLRSVVSMLVTLTFVFGLGVLVYEYGILDFLGVQSLSSSTSLSTGMSWIPPIVCFSIMVGLSLDYDVFLISRILEYRLLGYSDHTSILLGYYKTGRIITAAGVIMAIAIGGLLFSQTKVLNQVAFLLTTTVLFDTFVVRTVVVPILMEWSGTYCWWPREMPEVTKLDDCSECGSESRAAVVVEDDNRRSLVDNEQQHGRSVHNSSRLAQTATLISV